MPEDREKIELAVFNNLRRFGPADISQLVIDLLIQEEQALAAIQSLREKGLLVEKEETKYEEGIGQLQKVYGLGLSRRNY